VYSRSLPIQKRKKIGGLDETVYVAVVTRAGGNGMRGRAIYIGVGLQNISRLFGTGCSLGLIANQLNTLFHSLENLIRKSERKCRRN
jgi:hypothetical protein